MAKHTCRRAFLAVESLEDRQLLSGTKGLVLPMHLMPAASHSSPLTATPIHVNYMGHLGAIATPGAGKAAPGGLTTPLLPGSVPGAGTELAPQDGSLHKGEPFFANIWHLFDSGICVEEFTSVAPALSHTVPLVTITPVKGAGTVIAVPPGPGKGCASSPTLPPELDPQDVSLHKGEPFFADIWHLFDSGICVQELT